MSIEAAFILPHPPLIIPDIGRGEERKIQASVDAYKEVVGKIGSIKADTIVLISSHCSIYSDYIHIASGDFYEGTMSRFNAGHLKIKATYDKAFVSALEEGAKKEKIRAGTLGSEPRDMDHGSFIPLYFLNEVYNDFKLVRIGISFLPFDEHESLGRLIAKVSKELGRKTVIIASGDLSHKLKTSGPYGYAKEGEEFDDKLIEGIEKGDLSIFTSFDPIWVEKAAECGLRTFIIMKGALEGLEVTSRVLSYEKTFGVGYGVASFMVKGDKKND